MYGAHGQATQKTKHATRSDIRDAFILPSSFFGMISTYCRVLVQPHPLNDRCKKNFQCSGFILGLLSVIHIPSLLFSSRLKSIKIPKSPRDQMFRFWSCLLIPFCDSNGELERVVAVSKHSGPQWRRCGSAYPLRPP